LFLLQPYFREKEFPDLFAAQEFLVSVFPFDFDFIGYLGNLATNLIAKNCILNVGHINVFKNKNSLTH
jgi:hypothetical protein